MENISKQDWFKTTAMYEYMRINNIDMLNGIAYGNSDSEINYATNTLSLVKDQWNDIFLYYKNKVTINFINDINNFSLMNNTINNNYY
jgi:hypothetical protein